MSQAQKKRPKRNEPGMRDPVPAKDRRIREPETPEPVESEALDDDRPTWPDMKTGVQRKQPAESAARDDTGEGADFDRADPTNHPGTDIERK